MIEFNFIRKKKKEKDLTSVFFYFLFNIEISSCSCSCMSRSFDFIDKLIAIAAENSSSFFFSLSHLLIVRFTLLLYHTFGQN